VTHDKQLGVFAEAGNREKALGNRVAERDTRYLTLDNLYAPEYDEGESRRGLGNLNKWEYRASVNPLGCALCDFGPGSLGSVGMQGNLLFEWGERAGERTHPLRKHSGLKAGKQPNTAYVCFYRSLNRVPYTKCYQRWPNVQLRHLFNETHTSRFFPRKKAGLASGALCSRPATAFLCRLEVCSIRLWWQYLMLT